MVSKCSAFSVGKADLNSGIGQEMWQVIAGRVVGGIGGSGMVALVSILITGESSLLSCSRRL
jgi:hypothetical protein